MKSHNIFFKKKFSGIFVKELLNNLKIIHLSTSDFQGGAARATYRIHQSLLEENINSKMLVEYKYLNDSNIIGPNNLFSKAFIKSKPIIVKPIISLLKTKSTNLHSPSLFPTFWAKRLNKSDADIVHLHWVQKEMISIFDIARIRKPIVWTFHDMWAFCGCEHVSWDNRWLEGYFKSNRSNNESGLDINKYIWRLKKTIWKKNITIIAPSKWMKDCAMRSPIMSKWPVYNIPNCISSKKWKPIDKYIAREICQIPKNKFTLVFGMLNENKSKHKGFDLLLKSLILLSSEIKDIQLIIMGENKNDILKNYNFSVKYVGKLNDEISLKTVYSAGDALVTPSRIDNFPNSNLEAQMLGIPVIGFNICGLKDQIEHYKTGYLAKPFDIKDLAKGIKWIFNNKDDSTIREYTRSRAIKLWSNQVVAKEHIDIYQKLLNK